MGVAERSRSGQGRELEGCRGKPGGADFTGEEWEQLIELKCLECNKSLNYEKDETIKSLITSVLNSIFR